MLKERVLSGSGIRKGDKKNLNSLKESLNGIKADIDKLPKNRRGKIDSSADKQHMNEVYDKVNAEVIKLRELSSKPLGTRAKNETNTLLKEFEDLHKSLRDWVIWNR